MLDIGCWSKQTHRRSSKLSPRYIVFLLMKYLNAVRVVSNLGNENNYI